MSRNRRGNKEGSIFRLKSGRWAAEVLVGYAGGKLKKKRVQAATHAAVRKRLHAIKEKLEQGLPLGDDRLTVGSFLDRWLSDYVDPNLRPKTAASYRKNIELHVKPALGRIPLSKLTAPDVQRFLNDMLESGSVRKAKPSETEATNEDKPTGREVAKGLSPRTVQMLRSVLRKALGQAVKWDLVGRNVVTLTDPPRVQRFKGKPLSGEQGKALIAAAGGDRLEALFVLALQSGLRLGEALGLRWADVDFEAKTLRIENTMQRVNGRSVFGPTKTERSRRILPLPSLSLEALRAHRRRQQEERLRVGPEWEDLDLVFATETGLPVDPSNVRRSFRRVLTAAKLPEIRFHDLRHSCATYLAASGVPALTAMAQLGHTEIRTTLEIYSHVMPEMLKEAKDAIEKTLGG